MPGQYENLPSHKKNRDSPTLISPCAGVISTCRETEEREQSIRIEEHIKQTCYNRAKVSPKIIQLEKSLSCELCFSTCIIQQSLRALFINSTQAADLASFTAAQVTMETPLTRALQINNAVSF